MRRFCVCAGAALLLGSIGCSGSGDTQATSDAVQPPSEELAASPAPAANQEPVAVSFVVSGMI
jgi:hypothetical protein